MGRGARRRQAGGWDTSFQSYFFACLQFSPWQRRTLRVSLCTLGTFHRADNGIEFNILRESFGGY